MIIYFLILLLVIGVSCFNNNLYHNKLTLLNSYNNNLDIDLNLLMDLINYEIIFPKNQIEINYFKDQFEIIKDDNDKINFKQFYNWVKSKTVLNEEELFEIYNTLISDNLCDLINFVILNKIINEN